MCYCKDPDTYISIYTYICKYICMYIHICMNTGKVGKATLQSIDGGLTLGPGLGGRCFYFYVIIKTWCCG